MNTQAQGENRQDDKAQIDMRHEPPLVGRRRLAGLVAIAAALVLAPHVSDKGFVLSLLCQVGIMAIFALSYNMLLGQTGLLSFGHAVYYGLGAIIAMHALNLVAKGTLPIPVSLLPFVGGLAGLFFGVVFGWISTQRAGTTFAMISLGIGEMVAASSLMLPDFFGGEGGVSGNRVVGKAVLGITYGPQIEVYYLIAAWALLCGLGMYALAGTPLGRMANAVRDNPERAQFVGYDPRMVRFLMVALSAFFAGVAGALTALNYEIVSAETLNAHTSGVVLLMVFVGGVGLFYGPVIGAALITVLQIALSELTHAWLFYFGLFFLGMVLYAPGGIASLIEAHRNLREKRLLHWMLPAYAFNALPIALCTGSVVLLVELAYALVDSEGSGDTTLKVAAWTFDAQSGASWAVAASAAVASLVLLRRAWREISFQWRNVHLAIGRAENAE